MRIYRQIVLLELEIEHTQNVDPLTLNVFSESNQTIQIEHRIIGNSQTFKGEIIMPDFLFIDINNINKNSAIVKKVTMDGIKVNEDKLTNLFKFKPNYANIPINLETVKHLSTHQTRKLTQNGVLVFNLFATDTIGLLLALQNKIEY